jgi:hypothetical protein
VEDDDEDDNYDYGDGDDDEEEEEEDTLQDSNDSFETQKEFTPATTKTIRPTPPPKPANLFLEPDTATPPSHKPLPTPAAPPSISNRINMFSAPPKSTAAPPVRNVKDTKPVTSNQLDTPTTPFVPLVSNTNNTAPEIEIPTEEIERVEALLAELNDEEAMNSPPPKPLPTPSPKAAASNNTQPIPSKPLPSKLASNPAARPPVKNTLVKNSSAPSIPSAPAKRTLPTPGITRPKSPAPSSAPSIPSASVNTNNSLPSSRTPVPPSKEAGSSATEEPTIDQKVFVDFLLTNATEIKSIR